MVAKKNFIDRSDNKILKHNMQKGLEKLKDYFHSLSLDDKKKCDFKPLLDK